MCFGEALMEFGSGFAETRTALGVQPGPALPAPRPEGGMENPPARGFSFFLLSWFHCEPSNRVNWGLRCFESFLLSQHSGDFRVLQTVHMHSLVLVLCASSQGHTVTCSLQGCPALQTHWCGHAWDPASVSRTVSMLLLLLIICPENV